MSIFKEYKWIWILIIVVLITGLFFPKLMDFDSAEYAGISMQMFNSGDWGTILNRTYNEGETYDYLDKPHILYWTAILGFKLFGVTDYGYRLISVLMSLVAAWAVFKTASMLYSEKIGRTAAIFFITAQTILLANHDVRTDTLLTAFTILSIYHITSFIIKGRIKYVIFGGAFLAAAVGTKGMIAVLVTGAAIGSYLLFQPGGLKKLWDIRWLLLPVSFFVALSPVLYFYYQQFDLHPEKLVNGQTHISGVKFILWTQSFERFAGDRAFVDNPEFSFLFHSFLWVFLPWSLLAYLGTFTRIFGAIKSKGKSIMHYEQLTFIGVWLMFIFMSLSSFKLPHYLNILIPLFAIFTASWLNEAGKKATSKQLKALKAMQWVIIVILVLLSVVIFGWAFPLNNIWVGLGLVALLTGSIFWYQKVKPNTVEQIWVPSAIAILLVNFLLNTHFYPSLNKYQGGSSMAAHIIEKKYPLETVYVYDKVYRTFDFYVGTWRPMLTDEQIAEKIAVGQSIMLFTNEAGKEKIEKRFRFEIEHALPDYHITMLDIKFLNPKKRETQYGNVYLLKISGE